MATKVEKRALQACSVRAESQGDEMALVGRAASFNVLSADLGGFKEQIAPTAFDNSLANKDEVKCLVNHDANQILGRTGNKMLTLSKDDNGLNFRCQLNKNSQAHRDLWESVKRGDLAHCSFSFTVPDGGESWDNATDETGAIFTRRTLNNVKLQDVACVVFPAYSADGATGVQARAAVEHSALLAKVLAMPKDWERQSRAHEIGKQILGDLSLYEKRGNQDYFADRCREACAAKGMDYCAHDNDFIFASPVDSDDCENCCRYAYECDPKTGEPIMDEDSRTQVQHTVSHSVRAARAQRRADQELRVRMRAQSGILSR